ncbi:MAG: hypothetical protein L6R37_006619 [Teloschistes peruensis]|nr:MAG: hypothetical protein L6R37_006619 [Teloschistes peruensis]
MGYSEDAIATAVLEIFDSLPAKLKPVKPTAEIFQWTSLSGIIAVKGRGQKPECLSLGTGIKCIPIDQVAQANGSTLHDWHAEIVALRTFNHFLLRECLDLATSPDKISPIIRFRDPGELSEGRGLQPFSIHDDLELHMYSSEAPCGDASMELVIEAQVDPKPWSMYDSIERTPQLLRGRGGFAELGIVRRKPARADAPQTLSKSCSDKLALKQCTSLLSGCTSLFVNPKNAYLKSLVVPKAQYSAKGCDRSFGPSGRMKPVADRHWPAGYAFRPLDVRTTDLEFAHSRRSKPTPSTELRTSSISAVFNPHIQEALILGRLQGRQKLDPKGASAICSKRMWKTVLQVFAAMGMPQLLQTVSEPMNVRKLKESVLFADRQRVKDEVRAKALKGWARNDDDDFVIEPD